MKRLTLAILVCTFALLPSRAGADDGGWWDWLWKWDPKFQGGSAEIHLLCLDKDGQRILGCEEWFVNLARLLFKGKSPVHHFRVLKKSSDPNAQSLEVEQVKSFDRIVHEFDFRVGYHHSTGDRYDDPQPSIDGSINVLNPMGMYHWHVLPAVAVGAGVGYATIYGDRFKTFSRVIFTPFSGIVYYKALAVRPEVHYLMGGLSAADFGDAGVTFSHKREWNFSIAVGFDLRRIGHFN
jgi:hypothetical protein